MTNEDIARAIQSGNRALAVNLLEKNRGIMANIARRYMAAAQRNRGAEFEDLMQAAALGMLCAVDAWDEERGAFLTVAVFYMQKEIRAALGLNGRKRIENEAPPVSLYSHADIDGEIELIETVFDPCAADPQESAEINDMRRIVQEAVNELLPDEREIITARTLEKLTRKQLSEELGKTPDELRKTETAALNKLRRKKELVILWKEYENSCWQHVGMQKFQSTWTSATEAAVIRREQLAARVKTENVY